MNEMTMLPARIDGQGRMITHTIEQGQITKQIQEAISKCATDIKHVSQTMVDIQTQGGWDAFWKKSQNIREIADHVNVMTTVQQKSLDLIVLLMGAAGRIKADYDIIIDSIEDLSIQHESDVGVLEYLVKIKRMVRDMKERDSLLESLLTCTNELRDYVEDFEKRVTDSTAQLSSAIGEYGERIKQFELLKMSLEEQLASQVHTSQEQIDAIRGQVEDLAQLVNRQQSDLLQQIQYAQASFQSQSETTNTRLEAIQLQLLQTSNRSRIWLYALSGAFIVNLILSIVLYFK